MADAQTGKELEFRKLNLSKQARHQVGRIAMLDELLRDIRTVRAFKGHHVLNQPEIVLWLSEKRQAEVGKLKVTARKVCLNDLPMSDRIALN